jgi:hypothetical protein
MKVRVWGSRLVYETYECAHRELAKERELSVAANLCSCRMLDRNLPGGSALDIERIVAELEQERDRISKAIASLKGVNSSGSARKSAAGKGRSGRQRRGGMSPAARKRLSEMMKKRWAERRKKTKSS